MKKTTTILLLMTLSLFMFSSGLRAQVYDVPSGLYPTIDAACDAIETDITADPLLTEVTIKVAAGTIVELDNSSGWTRAIKVTIEGAGADKTFVESFSGHRAYPGEPDENSTRFMELNKEVADVEVILKDITFRYFGRGDNDNGGLISTGTNKGANLKISAINVVFDRLETISFVCSVWPCKA